jgi:hypothetical protein
MDTEAEVIESFLIFVFGLLSLQIASGQHFPHIDCFWLPPIFTTKVRPIRNSSLSIIRLIQHLPTMKQPNIIADLIIQQRTRTNKGLTEAGIDRIFSSFRLPPLQFLLVFELVQPHDIEVTTTTLIDVVDKEMLFHVGG